MNGRSSSSSLLPGASSACKGSKPVCSHCGFKDTIYDTAREPRGFEFVPLGGFTVVLLDWMRRVDCGRCGVVTERVPWADGKNRTCTV